MKFVLLSLLLIAGSTFAQTPTPTPTPQAVKAVSGHDPVFPEDAKNYIYGDTIRMSLDVDKTGKVTAARAMGPLAPCSNLGDPVVERIRKAAVDAAKGTAFAPVLDEKGQPMEATITIFYKLHPAVSIQVGRLPYDPTRLTVVKDGVVNVKAISMPRPAYPRIARMSHAGGAVAVQVLIDEDGKVISAGPLSGHPDLLRASQEAACSAKFAQTLQLTKPVKVTGIITYNFVPN